MAAVKTEPVVLSLNLLIDEKNNRVVAAEANRDFVDTLFSFFTFPMGTIIRLITSTSAEEKPTSVAVGCMNKLYEGVQKLSTEYWQTEYCKSMLLNPRNPLAYYFRKLKINIDDSGSDFTYGCWCGGYHSIYENFRCKCGAKTIRPKEKKPADWNASSKEGAFLKGAIEFLITDDLQVRPASAEIVAQLMPDTGSKDATRIREMCVNVSKAELILLLARSLVSESPLSDVFLTKDPAFETVGTQVKPSKLGATISSSPVVPLETTEQNGPTLNLKVSCVKSTKQILFGEATNEFFDFLCTFLTTPIGLTVCILKGQSGIKCMDNLYTSIVELDQKWFRSSNKSGLLDLCVAQDHNCKKQPIKSLRTEPLDTKLLSPKGSDSFAVEPSMFFVSDDFEVKPLSVSSSYLLLNKLEISFNQTEVQWVTIGMKEAMSLLKAALTSPSSALTIGLGPFLQKQKP
ncbi:unnamed protein product [Cuscuta epithymum]|uniref:DUF674 family protein n=1 Tax=Cuscuta epithymum TaxID=186058 RepID=A0AAV0CNL0_9ASTE|nr:unnamed protein product [Cuscuta epithymum]